MSGMTDEFNGAVERFLSKVREVIAEYYAREFPRTKLPVISTMDGQRYIRVVREDSASSRSSYCFIDKQTGDILKAASWKAPAKGARGSIFGDYGNVTAFSAGYCR